MTSGKGEVRRPASDPGDLDGIDFKPFFDMVVGVLFVLLILISAQMFFSQWGAAHDPAKQDAEAAARAWEQEQRLFLKDLAERLRAEGFDVSVDDVDRSIAVPL